MSTGILVAPEGQDVDVETDYDSRNDRLQVAVNNDPSHSRTLILPAVTAIQANVGNGFYAEETLFSMEHKLKYPPKWYAYFLLGVYNNYYCGKLYYDFGAFEDIITCRVTDTTFSIIHSIEAFDATTHTSTGANDGVVRVKYLVCSAPIDNPIELNTRG